MTAAASNPLLEPWTTPFEAPPFPAIRPEHFAPAFEVALKAHNAEIDAIAADPAAPTFANTIEAMERAGDTLDRVAGVFWNLSGSNTNDALQALEREWSPKFAAHHTGITTNAALFKRIDTLFAARDTLGLNTEQLRLLEKTHKAFVRSGAKLEGAARDRYKALSEQRAKLTTKFGQNVLADEKAYALELESEAALAGLPEFVRATSAAAAAERGHKGTSRAVFSAFCDEIGRASCRERVCYPV